MDLDFAMKAAQFLFTVLVGAYSIVAARRASSKAEAELLAERLTKQDTKILVLEQLVEHLPDSEQMHALAGDMKAIKVEIAAVAKALDPLTRSVDRINDFLLSSARQ